MKDRRLKQFARHQSKTLKLLLWMTDRRTEQESSSKRNLQDGLTNSCSRNAISGREQHCAPDSMQLRVIWLSFKTLTWSMIRASIPSFLNPSWKTVPMLYLAPGSWAADLIG